MDIRKLRLREEILFLAFNFRKDYFFRFSIKEVDLLLVHDHGFKGTTIENKKVDAYRRCQSRAYLFSDEGLLCQSSNVQGLRPLYPPTMLAIDRTPFTATAASGAV